MQESKREAITQFTIEESYHFAIETTKAAGSNFYLAFRSLPKPMYRAMCAIYAFMRITDDLVDDTTIPLPLRTELFEKWQQQCELFLHQRQAHPLFPALADVLEQFPVEQQWLLDAVAGMKQDLQPQQPQTFAELQNYCYRVAGTSGLCCQAIWGSDLKQTRELAIACGEAFQLTNIIRDVREDAELDRCYLPQDELHKYGSTIEHIRDTDCSHELLQLLRFQLNRTATLYQQAKVLDQHLSGPGRRMFRVMFGAYHGLYQKINRDPSLVLRERVKLPRSQKLLIFLTSPLLPLR